MKKLRSIFSVVLVLSIIFVQEVYAFGADAPTWAAAYQKEQRMKTVFQQKLDEMSCDAQMESSGDNEIETIKKLSDFCGNQYTLVELSPQGYMIFNNESGSFSEYSASAPSPYLKYEDNLYYCGPTEYYVLAGDDYIHTITGEQFSKAEAEPYIEFSETLAQHYLGKANNEVLAYIENGKAVPKKASAAATQKCVSNAGQIISMVSESEMSYCSPSGTKGICGYIAAAITLAWYDTNWNGAIIDNTTYFKEKSGYNVFAGDPNNYTKAGNGYKQTLSYNLWHYCSSDPNDDGGTWPNDVADTINKYLTVNRKITSYKADWYLPPTKTTIKNTIDDNKPVILMGELKRVNDSKKKEKHAVVVYGYSGDNLITHMGWFGYSNVYVEGLFGGMVLINRK